MTCDLSFDKGQSYLALGGIAVGKGKSYGVVVDTIG